MSLRTVQGQPIGVTLQEGVIEDSRGSRLTEFIEMSTKGGTEYVWTAPAPFACEVESTFGMPTWLFWTLIAIVIVAIITIVITNVVGNRRPRERRHR